MNMKRLLILLSVLVSLSISFSAFSQSPTPTIFLGAVPSGGECSRSAKLLSVRNVSDSEILNDFSIVSYEVLIGEKKYQSNESLIFPGKGAMLSTDIQNHIQALDSGETISIVARVSHEGVIRNIGTSFIFK